MLNQLITTLEEGMHLLKQDESDETTHHIYKRIITSSTEYTGIILSIILENPKLHLIYREINQDNELVSKNNSPAATAKWVHNELQYSDPDLLARFKSILTLAEANLDEIVGINKDKAVITTRGPECPGRLPGWAI